MADIDQITIVRLRRDDALAGLALSTEAHWNQNEADWRFFLTRGIVFGVRDTAGRLVATAALLPYTSENAWISMVLVTESWRRRGLATRLVDTCVNTATKLGLTTWLDATPAGAAVYGPLGFTPTIQLRRLRLENASTSAVDTPPPAGQLSEFITCDIGAMGFDRRDLLDELGGRPRSRLLSNGDAMALVRDGRTARHIGPLFADGPAHALAMVGDIVAHETGPLLIDAVANQDAFLQGLTDMGWTIERPFQRMRFGRAKSQSAELPFAVAGPEYG
jgi:GNAT superfamily N-acetyltransferase